MKALTQSLLLTAAACLLSACTASQSGESYLAKQSLQPTDQTLPHCYGYGCARRADIHLSDTEWLTIRSTMMPPTENAAHEREKIARAIAAFEQLVGKTAGTDTDKAGTLKHMGAGGLQLDCIDESINTTIYLQALQERGLLLYHSVGAPMTRLPIIHAGRWPHRTAVIADKQSGEKFAVDSWFHDNGQAPEIIPLKQWKDGWKPD